VNSTVPVRVFIADNYAIVRKGLQNILSDAQDMIFAGEAQNGLDTIKLVRNRDIDVLLLDIAMPDRNGIEILKQLRKEKPELAILIFSAYRENQYAIRALKAGAAGYLSKQSELHEVIDAIRQVAAGQKYISHELAQELARSITENREKMPHELLSDREFQTLLLIGSGKSAVHISRELSLSVKTISEYRSRILAKMNLKTTAELIHYAIKYQLVE